MKGILSALLNLIFPQSCLCCGTRLALCEKGFCVVCDANFARRNDIISPNDNETVRLLWGIADIENGAAWVDYVPHSHFANIIYAIKYDNRPDVARLLGNIVADEFATSGFFDGIDIIIPMPLHRKRELQRGYNQSREFANGLSERTRIPVGNNIIARTRNTKSQTLVSRHERTNNVADAFTLTRPDLIEGRHALVVDDIITTGSSLKACITELNKAQNARFSFLTIGKTKG